MVKANIPIPQRRNQKIRRNNLTKPWPQLKTTRIKFSHLMSSMEILWFELQWFEPSCTRVTHSHLALSETNSKDSSSVRHCLVSFSLHQVNSGSWGPWCLNPGNIFWGGILVSCIIISLISLWAKIGRVCLFSITWDSVVEINTWNKLASKGGTVSAGEPGCPAVLKLYCSWKPQFNFPVVYTCL